MNSQIDKKEPSVTFGLLLSAVSSLPSLARLQTFKHKQLLHSSYGCQNKLTRIRKCPVAPPSNKKLRMPQDVVMHWVPLKVTTTFLNAAFQHF